VPINEDLIAKPTKNPSHPGEVVLRRASNLWAGVSPRAPQDSLLGGRPYPSWSNGTRVFRLR
jgi:hypothetical protein